MGMLILKASTRLSRRLSLNAAQVEHKRRQIREKRFRWGVDLAAEWNTLRQLGACDSDEGWTSVQNVKRVGNLATRPAEHITANEMIGNAKVSFVRDPDGVTSISLGKHTDRLVCQ